MPDNLQADAEGMRMSVKQGNGAIPRRAYGATGEMLSVVALGGIVLTGAEQSAADRVVADAVERGVNYFDVAPGYGDAEIKLGPALEPFRKDAFLACKTGQRTAAGAAAELAESLDRLRTDHLDLYQLHGLCSLEADVDVAFGPGGAMETLIEAKRTGRARYLGFSAHNVDAALTAMDRYDFDSILFPINFAAWLANGFGPRVVERASAKGVARLGLKAMARQKWPADDPQRATYAKCWYQPATDAREADLALRWALSQPVTAVVPPGEEPLFRLAMDLAADLRPVAEDEVAELRALAGTLEPVMP